MNDYIEVPYNSALNGSTSSYTLWCRADALDANFGSPLTTRHGSPRAGFSVYKQPDNFWRLMIGQSSDAWSSDSSAIPVDQGNWVFISVLVESSTASLFVDGELAQNLSNLVLNSSSPLRFGAGRTESTADYFFNGSIDDVRIYNRALSVSEISALYTLESQPFDQFSPIQIVDSNVTGVSSRGSHALFQKTDGSLWAMGANEYGQLGDGTTTDRHTPIQIVDENVTTFSAGGDHSRFVQADGSLWAMGRNHAGQIGDGTNTDRASPVKVVNSGVAEVASGLSHGYYLTTSGDLWAMGWNADGQLGDGTVTNRNTPVQVLNGSNVSKMSAGSKEGYFIKEDGAAWAMGRNDFGQLGHADTADQSTPEIIFGWKELTGHSQARHAYDGLEVIDGKLYFAGGSDGTARDTFERYDPLANQWTPLPSLNSARSGMIGAVLNDQFYAIGGSTLSSVEIYDPSANSWSFGSSLPEILYSGRAITLNGKILVFGGHDVSAEVSSVREYDPGTEEWTSKASMNTARHAHQIAVYDDKIWIMGGTDGSNYLSTVEIYDPATDSWSAGPNLTTPRHWAVAWVANEQLFIGGGRSNPSTYLDTIESYDPDSDSWSVVGSLPSTNYVGGVAVIEDKLFLLVGSTSSGVYSNKLYVSDMQSVREIRGNSSTGHTLLVKADNSFGAMGQNNYGQLGDNSLADKSYPVSLMNTYDVVMTSGTGGSATGAGIYYAGAEVTIGASPSPGYLFGNWSGDFSSTDANDSFIINADYVIAASFSQDTEDDDDDGLNNYYELAVLGSNPLSGDTDGDGFSDLDENTTGLDPTVANTALYNHLSNLVDQARSEGNATGYQAGLSDGNASGILYVQNNKTLYDLYTQEEANSSANARYADGVTEGNASGIAWASQNWSLYSLYTGEEKMRPHPPSICWDLPRGIRPGMHRDCSTGMRVV